MSFNIEAIVAGNLRENDKRNLKPFTLFWKTGQRQVVHGHDAAGAMNSAGYGSGALPALDFWKEGDSHEYTWNSVERNWHSVDSGSELIHDRKQRQQQ